MAKTLQDIHEPLPKYRVYLSHYPVDAKPWEPEARHIITWGDINNGQPPNEYTCYWIYADADARALAKVYAAIPTIKGVCCPVCRNWAPGPKAARWNSMRGESKHIIPATYYGGEYRWQNPWPPPPP